ncbi:MAG: ABC transporter permease [Clostridiales bacterium]|nr:ABC transporter permease [Clostridiales bacterium]
MKKTFSFIYIFIILAFLYLPILLMIFFSFNSNSTVITMFEGFTLQNYIDIFKDSKLISVLLNSLLIAFLSATFSSILGTMATLGIYNLKKRTKKIVLNISNLPIINPEIVTGVSLMLIFVLVFSLFGGKLGFLTVLLSHICFNTPYVILNVLPRLRRMDVSLYEASLDLGCSPTRGFFRVVFPEIFPGILAGFLISFTYSIDDFVISYFTGGTFQTLSVYINNSLKKGPQPWMLAMSGLLFIVIFLVLIIINIKDVLSERKTKARL